MTKAELENLRSLKREVEEDTRRIAELRARATNTVSVFTGMPMNTSISDKTALAADIADLENAISNNIAKRYSEYKRLYDEIQAIKDSKVRRAIQLYYYDGLTWLQVAFRMGEHGEHYPRRLCEKYFKKRGI